MTLTVNVLAFSFLICLALLLISGITINYYIYRLFDVTLRSVFSNVALIVAIFVGEIVIVALLGFLFSYFFARALNKKL